MKRIIPVFDKILIKRIEPERAKVSPIIIPDISKEKSIWAEVIEVGPGARNESGVVVPISIRKGQTILIGKYSGTEISHEGTDYVLIKEADVLAILE